MSDITFQNYIATAISKERDQLRADNERLKGERDLLSKELQFRCDESDKQDIDIEDLQSTLQHHKQLLVEAKNLLGQRFTLDVNLDWLHRRDSLLAAINKALGE